jgi:hypothetical protein
VGRSRRDAARCRRNTGRRRWGPIGSRRAGRSGSARRQRHGGKRHALGGGGSRGSGSFRGGSRPLGFGTLRALRRPGCRGRRRATWRTPLTVVRAGAGTGQGGQAAQTHRQSARQQFPSHPQHGALFLPETEALPTGYPPAAAAPETSRPRPLYPSPAPLSAPIGPAQLAPPPGPQVPPEEKRGNQAAIPLLPGKEGRKGVGKNHRARWRGGGVDPDPSGRREGESRE